MLPRPPRRSKLQACRSWPGAEPRSGVAPSPPSPSGASAPQPACAYPPRAQRAFSRMVLLASAACVPLPSRTHDRDAPDGAPPNSGGIALFSRVPKSGIEPTERANLGRWFSRGRESSCLSSASERYSPAELSRPAGFCITRGGKSWNTAVLNYRLRAFRYIISAFDDVTRGNNITTKTTARIRDARQMSSRVFRPKTIAALDRAIVIARRLQAIATPLYFAA